MKKFKTLMFALATTLLTFSIPAFAERVGNSNWGFVDVYAGNGPGKAGVFIPNDGYRRLRFYNNTSSYINCKAENAWGEWVRTGALAPNAFKDIGIGVARGVWSCWYI